MGHEDPFRRLGLSGRYMFGEATFAGTRGNDPAAPKAADRLCKISWVTQHEVAYTLYRRRVG
jgi:hypothetical protein